METKIFNWKEKIPKEELDEVVKVLKNDGLIVFPTDTVYGLGCNCFSIKALNKIFDVKQRNKNKPINVLTNSVDKINQVVENINSKEKELMDKYFPGALTIIIKKNEKVPDLLTSGLDSVGVRIPDNEIALKILERVSFPLATTSANISQEEAGIDKEDVLKDFKGKVDIIIDGGITNLKVASTIVKLEDDEIKVLRQGTIKVQK